MKRDRESSSDDSDDGIILTRNRKRERMKVLHQKFLNACVSGKFKDVEICVRKGVDVKARANTGILSAAKEGHVDIVDLLIQNGADVNAVSDIYTHFQRTALHLAAEKGHVEV